MVLSLSAKGLTHGEISDPRIARGCSAAQIAEAGAVPGRCLGSWTRSHRAEQRGSSRGQGHPRCGGDLVERATDRLDHRSPGPRSRSGSNVPTAAARTVSHGSLEGIGTVVARCGYRCNRYRRVRAKRSAGRPGETARPDCRRRGRPVGRRRGRGRVHGHGAAPLLAWMVVDSGGSGLTLGGAGPSGSATETGGGPVTARPEHHVSGAPHREDRRDGQECGPALSCSPRVGRSLAVVERSSVRRADGSTTLHASLDRGTHSAAGGGGGGRPRECLLVAPDLVVTAGSWTGGSGLRGHVLLFAARCRPRTRAARCSSPPTSTRSPRSSPQRPREGAEWVVLRLAAAAVGRLPALGTPHGARRRGRAAPRDRPLRGFAPYNVLDLRAVGPSGPGSFVTDLEPFGGDCGAPVISSRSHLVEGVLAAGRGAAPPGRRGTGERVTRIGELVHAPSGARPNRAGAGDASATAR